MSKQDYPLSHLLTEPSQGPSGLDPSKSGQASVLVDERPQSWRKASDTWSKQPKARHAPDTAAKVDRVESRAARDADAQDIWDAHLIGLPHFAKVHLVKRVAHGKLPDSKDKRHLKRSGLDELTAYSDALALIQALKK